MTEEPFTWTEENAFAVLRELAGRLGRSPSHADLRREGLSALRNPATPVVARHGGYLGLLRAAGIVPSVSSVQAVRRGGETPVQTLRRLGPSTPRQLADERRTSIVAARSSIRHGLKAGTVIEVSPPVRDPKTGGVPGVYQATDTM